MVSLIVSNIKFEINKEILKELPDFIVTKYVNYKFSDSELMFNKNPELFEEYIVPYLNKVGKKEFNEIESYDKLKEIVELFNEVSDIFKFFCLPNIEFPIYDTYNPNFIKSLLNFFIPAINIYSYVQERLSKFDNNFPYCYLKVINISDDETYILPDTKIMCSYIPIYNDYKKKFLISYFKDKYEIEIINFNAESDGGMCGDYYLNLDFPCDSYLIDSSIEYMIDLLNLSKLQNKKYYDTILDIILSDRCYSDIEYIKKKYECDKDNCKFIECGKYLDNYLKNNIFLNNNFINKKESEEYKYKKLEGYLLDETEEIGEINVDNKLISEKDFSKLLEFKKRLYHINEYDIEEFSYINEKKNSCRFIDFLVIKKN
jgi:hypothetical protein